MHTPEPRTAPARSTAEPPSTPAALQPQPLVLARERAIQILTEPYAEHAIDEVELEARIARLHAESDPLAVDGVVRDLLQRAPLADPAHAGALAPVPVERRILAVLGEVRRIGRWVVPRVLRVRAFLGEVADERERRRGALPSLRVRGSAFLGEVRVIVRDRGA